MIARQRQLTLVPILQTSARATSGDAAHPLPALSKEVLQALADKLQATARSGTYTQEASTDPALVSAFAQHLQVQSLLNSMCLPAQPALA